MRLLMLSFKFLYSALFSYTQGVSIMPDVHTIPPTLGFKIKTKREYLLKFPSSGESRNNCARLYSFAVPFRLSVCSQNQWDIYTNMISRIELERSDWWKGTRMLRAYLTRMCRTNERKELVLLRAVRSYLLEGSERRVSAH